MCSACVTCPMLSLNLIMMLLSHSVIERMALNLVQHESSYGNLTFFSAKTVKRKKG